MHVDNTEKIDRYLRNEMPEHERKTFNEAINTNRDLANEVKSQQEIIELIELLDARHKIEAISYKEELEEKHIEELKEKPKTIKRITPVYYLAAASLLLLIGSLFILQSTQKNEYQIIANQYYSIYLHSDERSSGDLENKDKAISFYQQAKYTEAINHLKQITDDEPVYQLMLGVAHYEIKKYQTALKHFNVIIDNKDLLYLNEAHWYAALTQLQLNKPEEAIQNLTHIVNDENAAMKIKKKAEELFAKINNQ